MRKFFKSLLSSKNGSISSKRLFGGIGFLVCIFIAIYSVVVDRSVPAFCSELLYTCAALLGIDSVTRAFYKNDGSKNNSSNYKNDSDSEEDENNEEDNDKNY